MEVFIGNAVSVLYSTETENKYMARNCLDLHEFCSPYNLEIICTPGHVLFVKYSYISKHIKLSHFNCTCCTVCAIL